MERLNVHLSNSQIANLKIITDSSGIVRAELIRRAIDEYIEKYVNNHDCGITGIINQIKESRNVKKNVA